MKPVYIVKNLAPWMIDELSVFATHTQFVLLLLRKQNSFYDNALNDLEAKGIEILIEPYSKIIDVKKLWFIMKFVFLNFKKLLWGYSAIIGWKSIIWFAKLDMTHFSEETKLHAQFATQPAIISLMLKMYFKRGLDYCFTFHAYDIYFKNKWMSLLVNNSIYAFSISDYNIQYITSSYPDSDLEKVKLARLGAFEVANTSIQKIGTVFTIGLLSWFTEKKGIIYLLEAVKNVYQQDKDIKLVLAGDGPLKGEYLKYIDEHNLSACVSYIGRVNSTEKPDFFRTIDAFLLPAISLRNDKDGIPVVLMEATSYGLPLISTNVSGIPEICINEFNGKLIEEKDVVALQEAIYALKSDFSLRQTFAKNSLVVFKKYNIQDNSLSKLKDMKWI
ncbi:Glycosyltransferase involved in cell wall bisynthesis [Dyadobacter koreensis]|uniref:Glycosyltransferase involved in cell wall bisynthesis n=1 Tax=Dyadobacter koreensis TaxID=408657 RepID=A0A1H6QMH9_9BACT|nr:glycosyltransferase [Dyadobacter koreensis]SEI40192.1 Glycosyltransferase involved in cell wall bisynthesis [Dyadobacter koreensis]